MSVEAYLDHFDPVSEFPTPHFENDTCGETAFAVIEHCRDGTPITGDAIYRIRADMAAHHDPVAGGTTMSELVGYFRDVHGLAVSEPCPYGTPANKIHECLLEHAGRDGVVLQVARAYNLTGNELGVRSHYVAIGAIHPTAGYLVGNGDDIRALASAGGHGKEIPGRWMSWAVIESAQPMAVAVVGGIPHHVVSDTAAAAGPATPEPTPAPVPPPAPQPVYFDAANIAAFRDELQQLLNAAQQQTAAISKALASLPHI